MFECLLCKEHDTRLRIDYLRKRIWDRQCLKSLQSERRLCALYVLLLLLIYRLMKMTRTFKVL